MIGTKRSLKVKDQVLSLHEDLTDDNIITIISSDFYDCLYDDSLDIETILDDFFMCESLSKHSKESFIHIHNIYNY